MMKNVLLLFKGCIYKGLAMSLVCTVLMYQVSYAQSKVVSGKVSDASGPLPGVSVIVKSTETGTSTDASGSFSISAPENATLVISFIGYEKQEIKVGNRTSINVSLVSDNTALSEVVVVGVGYGTQKRKDLTGAISSVSAATIEKVPVTNLNQALQGRAAGVQVTNNDGAPGGNTTVLIRGIGSLASNGNGPLYIVDGYPIEGGINNINPSDIGSLDILKDASATAIYGVRAANGVVIVTTKKGRKDGVQVAFDTYNAFQAKPKQYKLLNAQQWATLANEVAAADVNFVGLDAWKNPSALTNADWQDALYKSGLTQNYSLALRGGSDKVQSAGSVGFYDQQGIVLGSKFQRITFGFNVDYQPTKWLRSSTSAKYTNQNANVPFGTGALGNLTQLIPTLDGGNSLTSKIKDENGNYGFYNPINTYTAKYNNPVYGIETNEAKNLNNFLLTNTSLEATLFSGLTIKTTGGINLNTYSGSFYLPEDLRVKSQYPGAVPGNALYSQRQNNSFEWLWENTATFDRTFGKHGINLIGGVSAQKNTFVANGGSVIPPNSVIRDLNQGTNQRLDQNGNGQTMTTLASQFGRLTYKFADKYLITGTVRRDGSSKFDEGHQYGIFPTGAIAWKVKEESFLKNVNWLSELKLRGSYGKVGNQGSIAPFQYLALYSSGSPAANSGNLGYPFNKVYQSGIAATQPANPLLRWETDYTTNLGVDAGFLNGNLTLTVDWFQRKSQDFLLNLAAPAQSGYNFLTRNVGSMENKGIEVALTYNRNVSQDFRYNVGLTFSAINNKLTSITSGTDAVTNFGGLGLTGQGWGTFTRTEVGQPVGSFYGYQSLGIFQSKAQIDALNAIAVQKFGPGSVYQKTATSAGDRYFADTNGDGRVTPSDQINLGSPIPKFFGGLNFDVSYKAFDLNGFFYGVSGNKILNYQESSLQSFQNRGFVGVENISEEYYNNRWTASNPSNTFSRVTYNDDAIGSNVPSSAWIQNGSFLRLKNVILGYTLPLGLVEKAALSKVRVYFSTQNVFTITKYKGLDPEIGLQGGNATQNGVDNGTYPGSRFYTVGLNVTLK